MQPFINLPIWINKSGKISLNTPFSDLVPHEGTEINFLVSDADTWIRFRANDGNTYPIYLPQFLPQPIGVLSDSLEGTQILSAGNDWQGNPLPTPTVGNIYWYGN